MPSEVGSRFNAANVQAPIQLASSSSTRELDIRISSEDSSKEKRSRDDPPATSSESMTEYLHANEDDYMDMDHSEREDDA